MEEQNTAYQSPAVSEDTAPLSMGNYICMMIVSAISIVGIVMMLVWGFGHTNVNRKNYARAALILMVIGIILSAILYGTVFAAMMHAAAAGAAG